MHDRIMVMWSYPSAFITFDHAAGRMTTAVTILAIDLGKCKSVAGVYCTADE